MTRLMQILERCVAKLDRMVVPDPTRPGQICVITNQLPETLEDIRGDLKDILNFLEKRAWKGDPK